MMDAIRGGLRALAAKFGIFGGVGRGGGQSLPRDFFLGRDVGTVTPAASLAEKKCKDVGRDAIRRDRPLKE